MILAVAATALAGLVTPSGNIRCFVTPGPPTALHCEIQASSYGASLQRGCLSRASVDWHGFELDARGRAAVTCSGGTLAARPVAYRTVPYGTTWRAGPFACASAVSGLTCRNRAGHGLFLARERWRGF